MEGETTLRVLVSVALFLANGFFVAAEYGLVGASRQRIEALAKKGNPTAGILSRALADVGRYVASIQIAITMCGLGIGAIAEPMVSPAIQGLLSWLPKPVVGVLSIVLVTFPLVVLGELVPKYFTLKFANRVALMTVRPLVVFTSALWPLVWLVQRSGAVVLRIFGIRLQDLEADRVSKEDLLLMVRAGSEGGSLDVLHASMVAKALKLDILDANDIMIHRIDIGWLDINTPRDELLQKAAQLSHSRIPVCRGDIDDVVGMLYLQDLVKRFEDPGFELISILRPVEAIPENLSLSRVIERMREAKSQILLVMDEYGGTSGLITLEDVVEEVFGELEDQLESDRPPIELHGSTRVSARADVRYDELVDFLGGEPNPTPTTATLAQMMAESLGRVPHLGDSIELPVGVMRVENMARRRITRLSIQLARAPASGAP